MKAKYGFGVILACLALSAQAERATSGLRDLLNADEGTTVEALCAEEKKSLFQVGLNFLRNSAELDALRRCAEAKGNLAKCRAIAIIQNI
jgi:hypothetical protein